MSAPKGGAKQDGWIYTREFEHARVKLDIENEQAEIRWEKHKADPVPDQDLLFDRSNDLGQQHNLYQTRKLNSIYSNTKTRRTPSSLLYQILRVLCVLVIKFLPAADGVYTDKILRMVLELQATDEQNHASE